MNNLLQPRYSGQVIQVNMVSHLGLTLCLGLMVGAARRPGRDGSPSGRVRMGLDPLRFSGRDRIRHEDLAPDRNGPAWPPFGQLA